MGVRVDESDTFMKANDSMTAIHSDLLSPVRSSVVDLNGRLYESRDETGDFVRKINGSSEGFFRDLFASGVHEKLFEMGFVETRISEEHGLQDGLTLLHKRLPFVTYACEWPGEGLRAAILSMAKIQRSLLDLGLCLKDGHLWNLVFEGAVPRFVDWGSIATKDLQVVQAFTNELVQRCLFPLWLKTEGLNWIAGHALRDVHHLPLDVPELAYFASGVKSKGRGWFGRKSKLRLDGTPSFEKWLGSFRLGSSSSPEQELDSIIRATESVSFLPRDTEWASYAGAESTQSIKDPTTWNQKTKSLVDELVVNVPNKVVDIGCNRGWYSQLMTHIGANYVLGLDIDEASLNTAFKGSQDDEKIHYSHFDLANPTPAHGLAASYPSPEKRWKADLVLALAVTHHLVFKRGMNFTLIAESLAAFVDQSGKLVVEFVPSDDVHVKNWMTPDHHWYTLDNFVDSMSRHFGSVRVVDAFPAPRVLCICDR
ncbi:MAG: class I SAM-dependent methyltransferase [Planctomycetota bacterium]